MNHLSTFFYRCMRLYLFWKCYFGTSSSPWNNALIKVVGLFVNHWEPVHHLNLVKQASYLAISPSSNKIEPFSPSSLAKGFRDPPPPSYFPTAGPLRWGNGCKWDSPGTNWPTRIDCPAVRSHISKKEPIKPYLCTQETGKTTSGASVENIRGIGWEPKRKKTNNNEPTQVSCWSQFLGPIHSQFFTDFAATCRNELPHQGPSPNDSLGRSPNMGLVEGVYCWVLLDRSWAKNGIGWMQMRQEVQVIGLRSILAIVSPMGRGQSLPFWFLHATSNFLKNHQQVCKHQECQ